VYTNFYNQNNDYPITVSQGLTLHLAYMLIFYVKIDNCYKTSVENCTAYPSNIKIDNVLSVTIPLQKFNSDIGSCYFSIRNVTGTSSGKFNATVASLVCSPGACGTIYLQDISLRYVIIVPDNQLVAEVLSTSRQSSSSLRTGRIQVSESQRHWSCCRAVQLYKWRGC
jgi:hypothetical protein